jgi:predicted dehydrogenase
MRGGGGSLMNQGLHNVDLLQWLLGPVVEVTAQYATLGHQMDAEDTTVATLRFASGALGVVVTSTATPPGAPAELAIHAEAGRIVLSQDGIRQWDVPAAPPPEHTLVASGAADPGAIGIVGHLTQWRDVLDAIRAGHPPEVSAADAAATVRLLCAIYEAGRTGRRVRLADLR